MDKTLVACVNSLLLALLAFGPVIASGDTAVPARPNPDHNGLYKTAQMSKAGSALGRAFAEYQAHGRQGRRGAFAPSNRFLLYSSGAVAIDARATSGDGAALLDDLRQLGLTGGSHFGSLVSGRLPIAAIDAAVALPGLRSVSAALAPMRNAGSVTSQGDLALRAVAARATHGVDGSGVTLGVISDSFDTLGGAAADIVSGDLPAAGVTVLGGESIYCSTLIFCIDEGRAMLQIVYDMAPGAALLFHTGLASKAEYANAITALAAAGARIVVDDLLYINEPMFQDGIVAQAVDAVAAAGVAYYSAAGNAGTESYVAAFDNSGTVFCIEVIEPYGDCHDEYERVGLMHDFDPGSGVDLYQSITIPVDGVLTVLLQWDEPFGGAGPDNDHDIVLLNETGEIYYDFGANDNIVTGEGWEAIQFHNAEVLDYGESFNLVITYDDFDSIGAPATLLKIVLFGSGNTINEYDTDSGTLFGHANAAGAQAVGAAFFLDTPAYGVAPPMLQPYSSAGGTPILFNTGGVPLAAPDLREKPGITAVDGVNTTFFFDDSHGSDGIDDFFGTSAAAPHAAGIAALMLEAEPAATPAQLRQAMEVSALDMDTPGFDHNSGHGLVQADAAIAAVLASPFEGIVALPNIGGSASPDIGVAVPGSTRVHIRDGSTGALISDINFGDDPAYDMIVIPDLDASGDPEIGVLGMRPSGQIRLQTKDSETGASTGNALYGDQYSGIMAAVVEDFGVAGFPANGLPEVAVLGQEAGTDKIRVMTRDVSTDTGLKSVFLGDNMIAHHLVAVADVTGPPGVQEVAVMGVVKASNQIMSPVRDAETAVLHQTLFWADQFEPVTTLTMADINGGGAPELVTVGMDPGTSAVRLQIRDVTTRAPITTEFLGTAGIAVDAAIITDTNANGFPDVAVLTETIATGAALVRVYDSSTGDLLKNVFYNTLLDPVGLAVLADYSAGGLGFDELAVLGTNGGNRQVQIRDSKDGTLVNSIDFP